MRIPVFSTLFVAAACVVMIGLGLWQLDRRAEKEALLTLYRANLARPAMAFPAKAPVADVALFRRSSAVCLSVIGWSTQIGRSVGGVTGYRWIAQCRTGAEGPGLLVDIGVSRDPTKPPVWKGGPVAGRITTEPSQVSILSRLWSRPSVLRPMLVADKAAPGLEPSAPPSPEDVPNNHLAYAVQWFLFAGIAALIYGLALRRRMRAA